MRLGKKMRMACVGIAMLMILSACGENQDWIFSIGGQELYEQDIAIWGRMFAKDYNIKGVEQLEEVYGDGMTYGEYYKGQLEQEMVDSVLLYREAEKNGFPKDEAIVGSVRARTEQFWDYYGKGLLSDSGIQRENVEKLYEMKITGEAYLESLTRGAAENKAETYRKVMEITFPTVEVDENGMVKSGTDGKPLRLPAEEVQKKQAEASNFSELLKSGEDLEELLRSFGKNVVRMEKYLAYSELDEAYKKLLDNLSEGEVSDVLSSDYGYYMVMLLDENAEDYAQTLSQYQGQKQDDAAREEVLSGLRSKYVHGQSEYRNDKKWKKVSFDTFIR